jgi:hypothetical protein
MERAKAERRVEFVNFIFEVGMERMSDWLDR